MKIIAVVGAYNENQTVASVVRELKDNVSEVIVVDDGSKDQTGKLAKDQGAIVLRHFLNRGQGAALKTGIDYALNLGADIIITFDADGQHDVKDIKALVMPVVEGRADVVLGSRFLKLQNSENRVISPSQRIPLLKNLTLKLAILFTRITTGLRVTDAHNGLRALSRDAAKKINILQDGMAHASEILEEIELNNLRYIEVPVLVRYTEYSKKKGQRISGTFKILWDLMVGKITR